MLQALTGQSSSSGGSTDHEATSHLVSGQPNLVCGSLESEHRVEDIDRDDWLSVRCIAGARCGESCHRASLVDTGVQDLPVGCFLVAKQQISINRHVLLAIRVVDLCGWEECIHTKGASLVRDDHLNAFTGAI